MAAADQDYDMFYKTEEAYRSFMRYPPAWNMLVIMAVGGDEEQLANIMDRMYSLIREKYMQTGHLSVIGPSEPAISRIKDMYRRVLYIKHQDYMVLVKIRDCIEQWFKESGEAGVSVFFDFNPMNMY